MKHDDITDIEEYVKEMCKTYKCNFWGQEHDVTPAFVGEIFGDGLQVIHITPIDTRPDWYLLRIDSKTNVTDDSFNIEPLLEAIEEEYDTVDRYECDWVGEEWLGKYLYPDDDEDEKWVSVDFPMLSWSGGMWGTLKNFGDV